MKFSVPEPKDTVSPLDEAEIDVGIIVSGTKGGRPANVTSAPAIVDGPISDAVMTRSRLKYTLSSISPRYAFTTPGVIVTCAVWLAASTSVTVPSASPTSM